MIKSFKNRRKLSKWGLDRCVKPFMEGSRPLTVGPRPINAAITLPTITKTVSSMKAGRHSNSGYAKLRVAPVEGKRRAEPRSNQGSTAPGMMKYLQRTAM